MKKTIYILLSALFGCLIMAYVEMAISSSYILKSFIKLLVFSSIPFIYSLITGDYSIFRIFRVKWRTLRRPLILAFGVYIFIVGCYFLLGSFFDFSNISSSLGSKGITKGNFLYVSLYISFANSFLEEFFFRGFCFLGIKKTAPRGLSYLLSAVLFSTYHVAIMANWFSLPLFLLLLLSLVAAGYLFNFLDEDSETIYPSWIVHLFANLAINTVGFILLN